MRIVSTVPSLTELLSYLDLDDEIVGITKFCIHPDHIHRSKTRVGGTKDLKVDLIRQLSPDLIIANKEENEKDQIEILKEYSEVLLTDISDLESAFEAILEIGQRTGTAEKAKALCDEIENGFTALRPKKEKKVLYLIWREPYMSIGHDTFIHDMLDRCGFDSVTGHLTRYPEVKSGEFDPKLILLSSEPYPFKQKHVEEIEKAWPQSEVKLIDGEYFSWYGSRMVEASSYFNALIEQLN
ncbi:MAG: ABC transporter substrate-binding protein [Flavobacteriales bacterium]|nr:ABC transporter substrate-binding protein [Flavobacteriales bacterium]NNK80597.1 ABC transporter substrate-binding protein [Flavobacteriales bacterium]